MLFDYIDKDRAQLAFDTEFSDFFYSNMPCEELCFGNSDYDFHFYFDEEEPILVCHPVSLDHYGMPCTNTLIMVEINFNLELFKEI
jgi:hypothetical protein